MFLVTLYSGWKVPEVKSIHSFHLDYKPSNSSRDLLANLLAVHLYILARITYNEFRNSYLQVPFIFFRSDVILLYYTSILVAKCISDILAKLWQKYYGSNQSHLIRLKRQLRKRERSYNLCVKASCAQVKETAREKK